MKSEKQLINLRTGLCGEYYVAAMMFKRQWDASLTQKNYPSVDLFGFNPETGHNIQVQIKTASEKQKSFLVGFNHDKRDQMYKDVKGPYVFVHLGDTVDCYILSKSQFIDVVNSTDDIYFNKPRAKEIRPDYPIAVSLKDLLPYKDQWDILWKD